MLRDWPGHLEFFRSMDEILVSSFMVFAELAELI